MCSRSELSRLLLGITSLTLAASQVAAQCVDTETERNLGNPASANNNSGYSLAISGNTILTGSPRGAPAPNMVQSGTVYVFRNDNGTFDLAQEILNPSPNFNDQFGRAVAIQGDTAVIGAPFDDMSGNQDNGIVYVFQRTSSTAPFVLAQTLQPADNTPGDNFGYAVAIDDETIVVGAPGGIASSSPGKAYAYRRTSAGTFTLNTTLDNTGVTSQSKFGWSVDVDGDLIAVGVPRALSTRGAAYGYRFVFNTAWAFAGNILASDGQAGDQYGWDVAMQDGVMVVGAPFKPFGSLSNAGKVYVNQSFQNGFFQTQQLLQPGLSGTGGHYGWSLSMDAGEVIVGAMSVSGGTGRAYRYSRSGNQLSLTNTLTSSLASQGDAFGHDVSVDRAAVAIGAPYADFSSAIGGVGATHIWALIGNPGREYCAGLPNSTGQSSVLTAVGTDDLDYWFGCLELRVRQLPPNKPGIFILSQTKGNSMLATGGLLCLGGPIIRIVQIASSNSQGEVDFELSTAAVPVQLLAGQTWNIQYWHRDVVGTNTSSAIDITFK